MASSPAFSTWEAAVCWLRRQPQQQGLVLASYYDDPLSAAADRYWRSPEWQALRTLLPARRDRALDVGAGRGIASYALSKEGFAEVEALEPDASAIVGANAIRQLAAECALPIRVTQQFSERLPFDDGSFDVVFARAVLHHTNDLAAACREFHRVLKPGGRLVAVREHVISRPDDLPAFLEIHPLHKLYGGENAFLLSQYRDAIRLAGFSAPKTLAPFDSPINFAPQTLASLRGEIAARLDRYLPGAGAVALKLMPPLWPLLRPLLNAIDQRPGRLYSFVADRA